MVTLALVGLWVALEKLLGPVQLQPVAFVALPVKVKVFPAQIGFGEADALTPVGTSFNVTEAVVAAVAEPQALLAVKL